MSVVRASAVALVGTGTNNGSGHATQLPRSVGISLLTATDIPVFDVERDRGSSPYVLTCDHAGRAIRQSLARLHLSDDVLATHVACDLGVADLGRRLGTRLDAWIILHNYSRLMRWW
jgi:predicted N-formylglutamate amidohydrolase